MEFGYIKVGKFEIIRFLINSWHRENAVSNANKQFTCLPRLVLGHLGSIQSSPRPFGEQEPTNP